MPVQRFPATSKRLHTVLACKESTHVPKGTLLLSKYRKHNASGQAISTIAACYCDLGPYGSDGQ